MECPLFFRLFFLLFINADPEIPAELRITKDKRVQQKPQVLYKDPDE